MTKDPYFNPNNPHAEAALARADEQTKILETEGFTGLRTVDQPNFPFPSVDDPMLAYVIEEAARMLREEGADKAITWGIVHAWYEGSLAGVEHAVQ